MKYCFNNTVSYTNGSTGTREVSLVCRDIPVGIESLNCVCLIIIHSSEFNEQQL